MVHNGDLIFCHIRYQLPPIIDGAQCYDISLDVCTSPVIVTESGGIKQNIEGGAVQNNPNSLFMVKPFNLGPAIID